MNTKHNEYVEMKQLFAHEMKDTELLAKLYHEICNEMVEKPIGELSTVSQSIPWKDLTDEQKKGRVFIAEKLMTYFRLFLK